MFQTYFKMAYRSLFKNKLSSFIDIFGLSAAIGCSIVAYLFVEFHYNKDTFHENAERIFLIENIAEGKDGRQIWGNSPVPLGPALARDFPQIELVVRVAHDGVTVHLGDKVFEERVQFVDKGFFDMFTFPLRYGEKKTVLLDRSSVVMNEEIALKYFGEENPVGQQIAITFNGRQKESFFVAGVTEEVPKNASFGFDILIPYEKQLDLGKHDFNDWKELTLATFIQLANPQEIHIISSRCNKYLELQNAASPDRPMSDFHFEPLLKMAQNSYMVREDIAFLDIYPGQIISVVLSGLFLLLLACFNHMNISIVSVTRRLKEIGVRKVMGSNRPQLIKQFIGENLLLCLIALVIGVALAEIFFIPGFKSIFHVFEFDLDLFGNIKVWLYLAALLLFTGIGAGAYPAFYISSYEPVNIFRGKLKFGRKRRFTAALLTFQFILSFITIVNGVVFIQNNEYQKNRDWGYNQEQVIVIPIEGGSQFKKLKDQALQNPNVLHVAGSRNHIGISSARAGIVFLDKTYEVAKFDIGFDYFETMGLRLKEGRTFKREIRTDRILSIIVNQTFVTQMGWEDAIGQRIVYNEKNYLVIGVVEDFHYCTFMTRIEPAILRLVDEEQFRFVSVRAKPGSSVQTSIFMQQIWSDLNPHSPYKGFFQDSIFEEYMQAMLGVAKISSFIAVLSLLVICMGIYALVSLTIAKRRKEISIRKVLGAGVFHITVLVNSGLVALLTTATLIALPLSYMLIKFLLDSLWKYHRGLDFIPFTAAFGLILFATLLTISSQVLKAAFSNPVDALRHE